jgi:hypothetical protein
MSATTRLLIVSPVAPIKPLNPWQPATATVQPGLTNGRFSFTYNRRELAFDLLYFVDISTNLATWDTTSRKPTKTLFLMTEYSKSSR